MILTTFYAEQNTENFRTFWQKEGVEPTVLTQVIFPEYTCHAFAPSNLPYVDDRFQVVSSFLKGQEIDSLITIVDWEPMFFSGQSVEGESKKFVNTWTDVKFIQEDVRVQDYRLPPFMENLIMISNHLGLDNGRLFKENPKLISGKIMKGKRSNLIDSLDIITEARYTLNSPNIVAHLPIINSKFFVE